MAMLDTTMLLKLSSEQKDAMQEAAEKLGLTSSELVRMCMEMCVQWVDEGKVRVVDGELTMAGALRREVLEDRSKMIQKQVEKAVKAYESVQRVMNDPKTQQGIEAFSRNAEMLQRTIDAVIAPQMEAIQRAFEERQKMLQRAIDSVTAPQMEVIQRTIEQAFSNAGLIPKGSKKT